MNLQTHYPTKVVFYSIDNGNDNGYATTPQIMNLVGQAISRLSSAKQLVVLITTGAYKLKSQVLYLFNQH
mgnify:CR=1 FL=1